MNKTTYTADKNAFIIDGELTLTKPDSEIKKGMVVIDEHNEIGIVKNDDDIHNTEVAFLNGGSGLYCLEAGCLNDAGEKLFVVTYSTKPLQGVKLLPREAFVKPQVDVEELAKEGIEDMMDIFSVKHGLYTQSEIEIARQKWIEGHNANKNQFTKEEMYQCALQFFQHIQHNMGKNKANELQEWMPNFINSIRPLSLPQ